VRSLGLLSVTHYRWEASRRGRFSAEPARRRPGERPDRGVAEGVGGDFGPISTKISTGAWRVLRRVGPNARAASVWRRSPGRRDPCEPSAATATARAPQRRQRPRAGSWTRGCSMIGRLSGSNGSVWQDTAIDVAPRQVGRAPRLTASTGTSPSSPRPPPAAASAKAGRPATAAPNAPSSPILEEHRHPNLARSPVPTPSALRRDPDQHLTHDNTEPAPPATTPTATSPPTSSTPPARREQRDDPSRPTRVSAR
jgi:hypothetical protein